MEDGIEKEIQDKGLTAPRVTQADVEKAIAAEYYFTAEQAVSGVTDDMVGRFLGWMLPDDFHPDAGIIFKAEYNNGTPYPGKHEPVGTNLFSADQARAMLSYVVGEGAPLMPQLSLLTFCVLVLRNGFTVTGESACASPANFDAEIGRKIARRNAVEKIWPLMGYELRTKLSQGIDKTTSP